MNDRFKFRAWDKDMEMVIYPKKHYAPKYEDGHLAEMYNPEENEFHIVYECDERFILMQCTDLKDKNGKLIYEGDIVREQGSVGKVIYEHDSFKINWIVIQQNWTETLQYHNKKSEIIGNIYENPELLK